jgi:serine/threonine protein kinase
VAIKTLLPSLSSDPRFVEMFVDEGKLVANLVHENIVQIYQLGYTGERYYIVMEYVNGLPLEGFAHVHAVTHQFLPEELAVFIVSRIARGLAYAHSRLDGQGNPLNIVHRDVCPTNVLITTEGLPKLADFGIAKARTSAMPLSEACLLGRLAYMSPEQARRQPLDYRSDIFSLGLVLFELLALRRAREHHDRADMLRAAEGGRVDWDLLPAGVSPALVAILRKMLAAPRDQRYCDTGELAHDLEYHIYHKGYGPTVVVLEKYLRRNFPYLYAGSHVPAKPEYGRGLPQATRLMTESPEPAPPEQP